MLVRLVSRKHDVLRFVYRIDTVWPIGIDRGICDIDCNKHASKVITVPFVSYPAAFTPLRPCTEQRRQRCASPLRSDYFATTQSMRQSSSVRIRDWATIALDPALHNYAHGQSSNVSTQQPSAKDAWWISSRRFEMKPAGNAGR